MNNALVSPLVFASAAALVGLALGLAYFEAVRRTADLLAGEAGWLGPAALTLARIMGAIIVLTFMARQGAMPLLAGFLGFLLARMIALCSARRAG
jgi:hypothetical protein